ncbi:MAG: hypothetical protein RI988_2713 [Pseudomonadota bacterium]|jgi:ABC-type lipoprotein export system ATPase subunit
MNAGLSPAGPLVQLCGVGRSYALGGETVRALRGIDLDIARGEHLAIMGASGSGKSTLMNILGLIDRPDTGLQHFEGADVGMLGPDARADIRGSAIGYVFQQFHLLAHLDAGMNVALPLRYRGTPRAERDARVAALLRAVGLDARRGHRPTQLSGGERQRVAIARALVTGPRLVLADEPTGALDSKTGQAVMELMMRLCAEAGSALVVITHDAAVASCLPRCVTLADGAMAGDVRSWARPAAGTGC